MLRRSLVPSVAAAALLLVGCSSSSPAASTATAPTPHSPTTNGVERLTAEQILARTRAAALSASSVRATGTMGATKVDLLVGPDSARLTLSQHGETAVVLHAGGAYYIKGDRAFWSKEVSPRAAALLAGRYVKVPASKVTDFAVFMSYPRFVRDTLTPSGHVTKGRQTTVAGAAAITLRDVDGSLLYVSLVGAPYPLRVENHPASAGAVTFTGWGRPVNVQPPPAAQVLDLSKVA
jgi:hypothetical protein